MGTPTNGTTTKATTNNTRTGMIPSAINKGRLVAEATITVKTAVAATLTVTAIGTMMTDEGTVAKKAVTNVVFFLQWNALRFLLWLNIFVAMGFSIRCVAFSSLVV